MNDNFEYKLKSLVTSPGDDEAETRFDRAFKSAMHAVRVLNSGSRAAAREVTDSRRLVAVGAIALAVALILILTPLTLNLIRLSGERKVAEQVLQEYYQYHPYVDEVAAFSFMLDHYSELSEYYTTDTEKTNRQSEAYRVVFKTASNYVQSNEYNELADTQLNDFVRQVPVSQQEYFRQKVTDYETKKLINYLF